MIIPLVSILQCWRSTLKPDWYARTYTVVCSSCHHNLQCGNFKLFFVVVLLLFVLFVCVLQRTARNCSKVRAARAALFSVLAPPIRFLITGVVISDPVVDATEHTLLSYTLHHSTYVNYRYPLFNFMV